MMFETVSVPTSEYDKLIVELEMLRRQRNDADTLRRQRDELLQALRSLVIHRDSKLSMDIEYIGIHQRAQRILAQYTEDAE